MFTSGGNEGLVTLVNFCIRDQDRIKMRFNRVECSGVVEREGGEGKACCYKFRSQHENNDKR